MAAVSQLGYLGLGVKDVGAWRGYAESLLGLRTVETRTDGDLLLAMDDHHHRFTLHEDERDDIGYVGWQTGSAAEMEAIAARLETAGVTVARGSRQTAEKRHVAGLIAFNDPDGHAVEVFHGPELADEFAAASESGFVARDQGLGHLVLAAQCISFRPILPRCCAGERHRKRLAKILLYRGKCSCIAAILYL